MSTTVGTPSPKDSPTPSVSRSSATFGTFGQDEVVSRQPSSSSPKGKATAPQTPVTAGSIPILEINGATPRTPRPAKSSLPHGQDGDEVGWGSNFWVTLVDPQTQVSFFACPTTGQVSWDAPVGHFVLPPSADGEWWELSDDSRGGLSYYHQTKTGETVWERPEGFVIPLGIIQNTALGRRLSQNTFGRPMSTIDVLNPNGASSSLTPQPQHKQSYRRSNSYTDGDSHRPATEPEHAQSRHSQMSIRSSTLSVAQPSLKKQVQAPRRSSSSTSDQHHGTAIIHTTRFHGPSQNLPPIPGSPYITEASRPPSPVSRKSTSTPPANGMKPKEKDSPERKASRNGSPRAESVPRSPKPSTYVAHRSPPVQSLNAAVELLTNSSQSEKSSVSDSGHPPNGKTSSSHLHANGSTVEAPRSPLKDKSKREVPPSPRRPIPAVPPGSTPFWARGASGSNIAGKEISGPMLNQEATLNMCPVKNRSEGKPIPVEPQRQLHRTPTATLSTGTYPILPQDLASDIQQFSESAYARQYFSKHRTGFIFRRRVPVAQMMTWQKTALTSPLLTLNRSLVKDAVKMFKVIQRIMGDRERDRAVGVRVQPDNHISTVASINNASTTSLGASTVSVLEEERWLLGEGLTHGELRDEIYCQVMKQLCGNPHPESVFKGWQFMCVLLITFPPSKNFETYLHSYMQQRKNHQEGRVDVMAKYCLRRLAFITKKGPRGKPPTTAEIETASDAAFNPSIFGESLGAIIRLQERNYPQQKVPIIMPFLADGILALGGTKSEGIFRVPGDGDSVSDLKLRIDRGYYTLDGVDDPHVLASLLKLWLRELCDPLVPEEMYNECVTNSKDPEACVRIVERLPTINRRVVLFVISFLQLFLDDRIQSITKMTPVNLALVMAPNLLRCNSDSMSVVYTNASYEQIFVYNLLLHLKCNEIDPNYIPAHGLGAVPTAPQPRMSKSRMRRTNH